MGYKFQGNTTEMQEDDEAYDEADLFVDVDEEREEI